MRLTVTNASLLARLALVASAAIPLAGAFLNAPLMGSLAPSAWPTRLIVGMSTSLCAFAAAPRSRRSDLIRMLGVYSLGLLLMDRGLQGVWRVDALVACFGGGCTVFACSCLEAMRRLARLTPEADVSHVYPTRKRLSVASTRRRIPPFVSGPPNHDQENRGPMPA